MVYRLEKEPKPRRKKPWEKKKISRVSVRIVGPKIKPKEKRVMKSERGSKGTDLMKRPYAVKIFLEMLKTASINEMGCIIPQKNTKTRKTSQTSNVGPKITRFDDTGRVIMEINVNEIVPEKKPTHIRIRINKTDFSEAFGTENMIDKHCCLFYWHQIAWRAMGNPTPPLNVEQLSHLCHNAPCANPEHLSKETIKKNLERIGCGFENLCKKCNNWEELCRHDPKCIFPSREEKFLKKVPPDVIEFWTNKMSEV